MKTCLIFNVNASSAGAFGRRVQQLAARYGVQVQATRKAADAKKFAKSAIAAGVERIIVAGGDGTVSQVLDGIAPDFDRVELAILPMGTGNDLARCLDLSIDDVDAAFAGAMDGPVLPIDVVRLINGSQSYFINAANGGFAGRVAAEVEGEAKERWGAFAYWMTALKDIIAPEVYHVELDLDGRTHVCDAYSVVFANGRYVGGGFRIAPAAVLDDGLLDVTIFSGSVAGELLELGVKSIFAAESAPPSQALRARSVRIRTEPNMHFSVDGELVKSSAATLEVIPRCLPVVVGDQPEGILKAKAIQQQSR